MLFSTSSKALVAGARRCRGWQLKGHYATSLGRQSLPANLSCAVYNIILARENPESLNAAFSTIPFDSNVGPAPPAETTEPRNNMQEQRISNSESDILNHPQVQNNQQQIQRWISANPKIAPYKAEEYLAKLWAEQQKLFNEREDKSRAGSSTAASSSAPTVLFTTDTVNLVLMAWCQSNNGETGALRAERLLRWMEGLHSDDPENPMVQWESVLPKPDYESYATVVEAWSRAAVFESNRYNESSSINVKNGKGGVKHVIPESTKVAFECAKRAEELLMNMQVVHEQRMASTPSYSNELQPDTRVFHSVLRSWANIRGGTKATAIRAMRILDLMQELHHYQSLYAETEPKLQPNIETYKLILRAWAHAAHCPEGPDRAEEILRHLLSMSKAGNMGADIMPDEECFHIVMKAHAESVRKRGASVMLIKAEETIVCSSVERARKVAVLLEWMELMALRPKSKIHPTTETYRIALSAWAWSRHVDAPKEAERILFKMIRANEGSRMLADNEVRVIPETKDFNTVINCCAFARGVGTHAEEWVDDEVLEQKQLELEATYVVAEGAFEALLSSTCAEPDSATFMGMMRACVNLLPDTEERDARVVELFQMAYKFPAQEANSILSSRMRIPPGGGCVDNNILRQLRCALPSAEQYIRVREEYEEFRRKNIALKK
ncbi:hypothetical protein ACHAXS_013114 [Conticribra weissflogii]